MSLKQFLMWIGIGVASLASLIGLIVWLAFYATSGLIDTIHDQLAALKHGDINSAYSYTSKDFQNATSLDQFKAFVNYYPSLKHNKSSSFYNRSIENGIGTVKGTLLSDDGAVTPVEYQLIKEDNKWKILFIKLKPTGAGTLIDDSSKKSDDDEAAQNSDENSDQSANSISLPNVFEDRGAKFAINFPAEWEYERPTKRSVVIGGKEGTPAFDSTVNIQAVAIKTSNGIYKDLTTFANNLKRLAKEQTENTNFLGEGSIDLPQTANHMPMQGRYLVFTYHYDGQKYRQLQFVFQRNDDPTYYIWSYTAPADRYQTDYPIAKAMFATWKVY